MMETDLYAENQRLLFELNKANAYLHELESERSEYRVTRLMDRIKDEVRNVRDLEMWIVDLYECEERGESSRAGQMLEDKVRAIKTANILRQTTSKQ